MILPSDAMTPLEAARERLHRLVEQYHAAEDEVRALRALAETIAHTTPREGQLESAWRALQARARAILSAD